VCIVHVQRPCSRQDVPILRLKDGRCGKMHKIGSGGRDKKNLQCGVLREARREEGGSAATASPGKRALCPLQESHQHNHGADRLSVLGTQSDSAPQCVQPPLLHSVRDDLQLGVCAPLIFRRARALQSKTPAPQCSPKPSTLDTLLPPLTHAFGRDTLARAVCSIATGRTA
jgi:hypothetical protein